MPFRSTALAASRITVVTLCLLLAACAPGPDTATPGGSAPTAGDPATGGETQAADGGGGGSDTIDFLWFTDGPDLEVMEELVAEFQEDEGVTINFLNVPYADLNERLRAQIAGGEAPDVVRLTDMGRFAQNLMDLRPHLSDPEEFTSAFIPQAMDYASGPDGEIHGIPHDFTMNGPFVNVTMFEEAGITIPGADDEPWTWEELIQNAQAAQEAGGSPYAIVFDRSGHRFAGMLHQFGGSYFTEDGSIAFDSAGSQEAVQTFVDLHQDNLIPLDVWVGSGSAYADAAEFFISQQAPVYFAGNWLVGHFEETIQDFEWAAMPNPCAESCGGFPGGKFVAALEGGDNPEAVAKLIEFLGSPEIMREYVVRSQFLPTRLDLIEEGLEYENRTEDMNVFLADIQRMPDSTYNDQYHPRFGPVADLAADQITRVIAGEGEVQEAMEAFREEATSLLEGDS